MDNMPTILTIDAIKRIREEDLPMLVLTDSLTGFFGWRVRAHTNGQYSHSVMAWKNDSNGLLCLSQEAYLRKRYISEWCSGTHRVKFWYFPFLSDAQRDVLNAELQKASEKSKWETTYDIVGILGQAVGLRWLQISSRYYCSEWCGSIIGNVEDIGVRRPTPADLNAIGKASPNMACYGVFDPDLSI